MQDTLERATSSVRNSQTLRLLAVVILALLLLIPVAMIGGLVSERRARRQEAIDEISSKWGNSQTITGPALVVPYTRRWTEVSPQGLRVERAETRSVVFLPEQLRIHGKVDSEVRSRGIFSVPVYRLDLVLEGRFDRPSPSLLGIEGATADWDRAHLAVGVSDVRTIQEQPVVTWNRVQSAFLPGTGDFKEGVTGLHARVGGNDADPGFDFSFPLALRGTSSVSFTPCGRSTLVQLESDSAHPSFQGKWLPTERQISSGGFGATWTISYLGRGYPEAWLADSTMLEAVEASHFGVELKDPVDHYRMAQRSVKYAGLFILLTFASVWIIEVLAGVQVHPIQYLLLGAALCLFYLLELSLSEHLGFPLAFTVASVAVIGMVAGYSRAILHRVSRALIVATGVAALYGYLYVLLVNEDFALLVGSIGLFAILAAIMFVTRRVDWYGVGTRGPTRTGPG